MYAIIYGPFGLSAVETNAYNAREKSDFYKLHPYFGRFHDIPVFDSLF